MGSQRTWSWKEFDFKHILATTAPSMSTSIWDAHTSGSTTLWIVRSWACQQALHIAAVYLLHNLNLTLVGRNLEISSVALAVENLLISPPTLKIQKVERRNLICHNTLIIFHDKHTQKTGYRLCQFMSYINDLKYVYVGIELPRLCSRARTPQLSQEAPEAAACNGSKSDEHPENVARIDDL